MKCKLCESNAICRGYCRKCYEKLKRSGEIQVKSHKENLVYGVGINDMPRGWANESKLNKRVQKLWYNMIERCYRKDTLKNYPSYEECYVCDRWLTLSNFVEDISKIDNYELWLNNQKGHVCLDKDYKITFNKCYSLDACMFMDNRNNSKEAQFRNGNYKQVVRIANDGSIKVYESTIAPQHEEGFSQACVSNCCRGNTKTYKGYKWMFLDDYELFKSR